MGIRWGAALAGGAALFVLYFLLSTRGTYITSDGASNALQAWDMLHGNLLMHGWAVSDVSFYTTELPEYMLVEAVRGLNPQVVHICGALTYTVLIGLAGALAIDRDATGRRGAAAFLIATGIMLAPEPGNPTGVLLLSPDHVGTGVPLLVVFLLVDRASEPARAGAARWLVPVAVGVLLAWTVVGDPIAELIGVVPLVLACVVRILRARARQEPVPWYEVSLAVAAVLAVPLAALATRLIAAAGGWTAAPVKTSVINIGLLPAHAALTGTGILQVFGADFLQQTTVIGTVFALAHLVGLLLAACGLLLACTGFFRHDLIVQVLALAIVLNLVGYMITFEAQNLASTRDIAAVLPFGAVLAGRLLAGRRETFALGAKATAVISVLLPTAYAVMLVVNITRPPVPAPTAKLTVWLAAHRFTAGLAGYWQANAVTLDSGGYVQLRAIELGPGDIMAETWWEANDAWYDPSTQYANVLVGTTPPGHPGNAGRLIAQMRTLAGPPVKIYFYDGYVIAEWHENLLTKLG
jgi:hypothetical protein